MRFNSVDSLIEEVDFLMAAGGSSDSLHLLCYIWISVISSSEGQDAIPTLYINLVIGINRSLAWLELVGADERHDKICAMFILSHLLFVVYGAREALKEIRESFKLPHNGLTSLYNQHSQNETFGQTLGSTLFLLKMCLSFPVQTLSCWGSA